VNRDRSQLQCNGVNLRVNQHGADCAPIARLMDRVLALSFSYVFKGGDGSMGWVQGPVRGQGQVYGAGSSCWGTRNRRPPHTPDPAHELSELS